MKKAIGKILLGVCLLSAGSSLAAGSFNIRGQEIPLMEDFSAIRQEYRKIMNLNVAAYTTDKPREEVFKFYQVFLEANGFEVIGGEEGSGYNVSVKKGEVLFTLRIYPEQGQTVIQFIW